MATKKKTGDPIDDLPPISRKALESAPHDGRYLISYTVGRVFTQRGWGDHLGKNNSRTSGMPTSLFQLNEAGLQAARVARQRSRSPIGQITYDAVYEATNTGISQLLEDYSLQQLIRCATDLIERIDRAGGSSAGARGYLDALVDYQGKHEQATA